MFSYNKEDYIIYSNGDKCWYKNGVYHREDGPAIEYATGEWSWYFNGKLHREDGPATIYADGSQSWNKNGLLHRLDGPAVKYLPSSDFIDKWFYEGERIDCQNQEEFERIIKLRAFW